MPNNQWFADGPASHGLVAKAPASIPTFASTSLLVSPGKTGHPWYRWFARTVLDYVFAALFLAILLGITAPTSGLLSNDYALGWVAALTWIPVEAVLLSTLGTTPGKYLVGLRVARKEGGLLTFSQALSRALSVWAVGCAFMIPIVLLFTFNAQYNRLRKGNDSSWDEGGGFVVIRTPLSSGRSLFLVLVVVGILGLIILGTLSSPR